MNSTLDFYDENAGRLSDIYEQVDFRAVMEPFLRELPGHAEVLEIGSGGGRDAAYLLAAGHEITGIDGSAGMIARAVAVHPELAGRLREHRLPAPLPFADASFDAVMSWAVLMHLRPAEHLAVVREIARVLRPGGLFGYSVNTERAGLDETGTDPKGRHFTCLRSPAWQAIHRAAGFTTIRGEETDDLTGRPGIRWATFVTRRRQPARVRRRMRGPRRR